VVWVSRLFSPGEGRLSAEECPVSAMRAESWAWLEEFAARRRLGTGADPTEWPAKRVDAMSLLESELEQWMRFDDAERG
jgi:hypothetical protein